MQQLSRVEYEELARGSDTLSADEHGQKVLLRSDGRVVKLFRRRRWLSSALWRPYAARFEAASRELARRDIAAARVDTCARVRSISRDVVAYARIEGETLRDALAASEPQQREQLIGALARFMAMLHGRGVYFRAAHFGNIVVVQTHAATGTRGMALIDLAATQFWPGPLSTSLRARNFRPMTRYAEDIGAVRGFGIARFVDAYLAAARLDTCTALAFRTALAKVHQSLSPT